MVRSSLPPLADGGRKLPHLAASDDRDLGSVTALLGSLDDLTQAFAGEGQPVPVIVSPSLRVGVRRLLEPVLPNVPVISLAELPPQASLRSLATWETLHAA